MMMLIMMILMMIMMMMTVNSNPLCYLNIDSDLDLPLCLSTCNINVYFWRRCSDNNIAVV